MDCNEARPLLGAAIDRELSAAEALRIETHLAQCARCRRETQMLRAVSDATRAAEYYRAPNALRERILAALPNVESAPAFAADEASLDHAAPEAATTPSRPAPIAPTRDKPRGRGVLGWAWPAWRPPRGAPMRPGTSGGATAIAWPTGLAAAAVALVLATGVALVMHRPNSAGTIMVDELVASHVRAQLSGHDIDVVSSDQHTVKPWFNGRIDYAPPVEDLADEGFALTGGRLDYIGHHRVAVLVYRYRKHIIDVYVMPETAAAARAASAGLTSDGYALANWRDQGMSWWAVSDAEPAVLQRLRETLTARLNRPPSAQPNPG
ncbi:zf-HC2 domain-containing protein [Trinickia sp. NRRL B-1857]|uniref:anti-sigma factor family protein n=1 Tax=Trinickia sp. NRRL B-1857 TaxID=3162879 RepID=UPI003D2D2F4F